MSLEQRLMHEGTEIRVELKHSLFVVKHLQMFPHEFAEELPDIKANSQHWTIVSPSSHFRSVSFLLEMKQVKAERS